jgi:hypothetical protein
MGEEGQTLRAVTPMKDNVLAGIAPTQNVIHDSGEFKTKQRCHGAGISKRRFRPLYFDRIVFFSE